MIKKAYVIGNNTKKSLSPTIFNYWFKKYGVKGEYKHIEVKEKDFNKKIKELLLLPSTCGFNITVPYKEKIIPHLRWLDSHSLKIGAVNCVTIKNNKVVGSNTDWLGLKNSIIWMKKTKKTKTKLIRKNAVVLGYGGSAKATLYALDKMGFVETELWNRSFDKIKNIKKIGNLKVYPKNLEKDNFRIKSKNNLVINTIPQKNFYQKLQKLQTHIIGYDLVYNNKTNFFELFDKSNTVGGINLLVHQAAPCFEK